MALPPRAQESEGIKLVQGQVSPLPNSRAGTPCSQKMEMRGLCGLDIAHPRGDSSDMVRDASTPDQRSMLNTPVGGDRPIARRDHQKGRTDCIIPFISVY